MEKRNRAEALILQAERQLREVMLDFGMQFARNHRQRIETLSLELHDNLAQDDARMIDESYAGLQDALYDLNQEVRQYYSDDEEDELFGFIRNIFSGKGDREPPNEDEDDNNTGSLPIPSPRRPGPGSGTNDSAELPPT